MTTTPKQRTITLTDRPPVQIIEIDWPVIAQVDWYDSEHTFQANRRVHLRVREHEGGRRIIYGVNETDFQRERGLAGGYLLLGPAEDTDRTIDCIHMVSKAIGRPDLAPDLIADLPAEVL